MIKLGVIERVGRRRIGGVDATVVFAEYRLLWDPYFGKETPASIGRVFRLGYIKAMAIWVVQAVVKQYSRWFRLRYIRANKFVFA